MGMKGYLRLCVSLQRAFLWMLPIIPFASASAWCTTWRQDPEAEDIAQLRSPCARNTAL